MVGWVCGATAVAGAHSLSASEQHAYATDRSPLAEFLKMFLIQKFGLPSIRDK